MNVFLYGNSHIGLEVLVIINVHVINHIYMRKNIETGV